MTLREALSAYNKYRDGAKASVSLRSGRRGQPSFPSDLSNLDVKEVSAVEYEEAKLAAAEIKKNPPLQVLLRLPIVSPGQQQARDAFNGSSDAARGERK